MEGRLEAHRVREARSAAGRQGGLARQDLLQSDAAGHGRLLRTVDLRVPQAPLSAGELPQRPGGAPQVAHHGRGHRHDRLGPELGRRSGRVDGDPRRGPRPRPDEPPGGQDDRRVLHVLPAAHLRALPEPDVRLGLPVGRDVQAHGGRSRPGRPGRLPRLAHVRLGLPVQEGLFQPRDGQGREVHAVLSPPGGGPADGLLGDLRRASALPRGPPLRRRPRHLGGLPEGRTQPVPRPPGDPPGSARPRRGGGGAGERSPPLVDRRGAGVARLEAHRRLRGRAPPAPRIPHAPHGVVRPALESGRRRRDGFRQRRRGPQGAPLGAVADADSAGVPRGALHRGRSGPGRALAPPPGRHALLHAGRLQRRPGRGGHRPGGGNGRRDDPGHVPAPRDRQVRRPLRGAHGPDGAPPRHLGARRLPGGLRRRGLPRRRGRDPRPAEGRRMLPLEVIR